LRKIQSFSAKKKAFGFLNQKIKKRKAFWMKIKSIKKKGKQKMSHGLLVFLSEVTTFGKEISRKEGGQKLFVLAEIMNENIHISDYTDKIESVIINPRLKYKPTSRESKKAMNKISIAISTEHKIAMFSIPVFREDFDDADYETRKTIFIENILESFRAIKKKLKKDFNYEKLENDIFEIVRKFDETDEQTDLQ
jgi:hypothetical protein